MGGEGEAGGEEEARCEEEAISHLHVDVLLETVHLVQQFQQNTLDLPVGCWGEATDSM